MSDRRAPIRLAQPYLAPEAGAALQQALEGDLWEPGPAVKKVEARIARHFDLPAGCVVATRSCTAAIHAAARHVENFSFRELSAPCLTYPGTYRWRPHVRLLDTDDDGWPIERPGVSVDLWGRPAPKPGVVHDAAHRFLAPEHPHLLRAAGYSDGPKTRFICYSFAPQKEVPCFMGGALVCRCEGDAQVIRKCMRNHHRELGPHLWGTRDLMPEPVAAMVLAQMETFEKAKCARRALLHHYTVSLEGENGLSNMTLGCLSSGHLCVVRFPSRQQRVNAQAALDVYGIEHGLHYQVPKECRNAFALTQKILTLPLHTHLDSAAVSRICRVVLEATKGVQ